MSTDLSLYFSNQNEIKKLKSKLHNLRTSNVKWKNAAARTKVQNKFSIRGELMCELKHLGLIKMTLPEIAKYCLISANHATRLSMQVGRKIKKAQS